MENSSSPRASKRLKLDANLPSASPDSGSPAAQNDDGDVSPPSEHSDSFEDHCSICLHQVIDRTIVPICSHEFCFECLIIWCHQSRRCPLCSQAIGDHVIHQIRSSYDYQKQYLPPLKTNSPKPLQARSTAIDNRPARPPRRERRWGRAEETERRERDRMELSLAKRRWVYENDLYAKHVASNGYTRFRSYPTPTQFAASPDMISRVTMFLRRELQVWVNLDVEFLTTYTISLMKALDIRSESAVKLLAEFLDMDYAPGERQRNAEHFAHEVYSFTRSPYRDLFVYDGVVQYDDVPAQEAPPAQQFWEEEEESDDGRNRAGPSRRRSPSRASSSRKRDHPTTQSDSTGRERSPRRRPRSPSSTRDRRMSWSPSGRTYPSTSRDMRGRYSHDDDESTRPREYGQVYSRQTQLPREPDTPIRRGDREEVPSTDDDLDRDSGKGKQRQLGLDDAGPKRDFSTDTPPVRQEIQIKGKARQLVSCTQQDDLTTVTKTNGNEKTNTNRRPDVGRQAPKSRRVNGLLQSVQDHLKLGTAGGSSTPQLQSRENGVIGGREAEMRRVRVSDPSDTSTSTIAKGTGPSSPPALLARLLEPSSKVDSKPNRVMKILGSAGLGSASESTNGSDERTISQNAGRRSVLLERLEQEKRRAQLEADDPERTGVTSDTVEPMARASGSSGSSVESNAVSSSVSRAEFLRAQLAGARRG